MAANDYTLEAYVDDLRRITSETKDENEILTEIGPLAQRLALDKSWLEPRHYETNERTGLQHISSS